MRLSRQLLVVISALTLASTGWAQDEAKDLIARAYAQTKEAKTVADFGAIIELCQQARQRELTDESQQYVSRLMAWTLNRRGETYVELAAAATDKNEPEQAKELDKRALADFEAAVQRDPQRWKALHNRGVSYALASRYEEALADFSQVVKLKADYANAWFNRAEIQYELNHFVPAIEDYTRAIELQPEDPGAYTHRGHAYLRSNRLGEAIEDYTQAIKLDERNAEAHLNRGEAYERRRQWGQAAADFRKAIELDPASAWSYQRAAWLMATCPDDHFRNSELGVKVAEKAIALAEHEHPQILDTLAASYANANRFAEAAATISRAIKLADSETVQELKTRLKLYESEQAYRQPSLTESRLAESR